MMRSRFISLILVLLLSSSLFFIQCKDDDKVTHEEEKHWSYDGETGPEHWGDLNPDYWLASHGKNQSPIDIVVNDAIEADLPNIQFHYEAGPVEVENNGHAIEVIPESGNYILLNNDTVRYNLLQFHFHSLSETTVDGNHYPIEGHLVHINKDGELAVIAVFAKLGAENLNYKPFWDHMPTTSGGVYDVHDNVNPLDLLPADKRYFKYSGSLTTPPCSEGVKWHVINVAVEMSQAQIDAFKAIYDHNYRPVQALNARQVIYDVTQ